MFQHQIQRVEGNIFPFVFIGLFVGLFLGKASWFRQFDWLNDFLIYARINTRYPDSGQILFLDHFDPNSLIFLLVAIFVFSAMHRLLLGLHERRFRWNFNLSIERLGSYLAIAWLGMIVGITVPVLIYQGIESAVSFLTNAIYPLFFLVEVVLINTFLNRSSLLNLPDQQYGIYQRLKIGIRLDGVIVLILGGLILTYQDKYDSTLYSFTNWVRSLFF